MPTSGPSEQSGSNGTAVVESEHLKGRKSAFALQPMENVDRNIFWYNLRDYVAGKIKIEKAIQAGENCIKLGDAIFRSSTPITLYHKKDGEKQLDVESIVFYCDFVRSPMYLTYMNNAITAEKIALRRGDVMDLKPFLLGKTDVLPGCIDLSKTQSPTPYTLVDTTPKVAVQIDSSGREEYYTLTHNVHPGLSLTFSGSVYNQHYYLTFLKIWAQRYGIVHCKQFSQLPVTKLVRNRLNLPSNCYDIFHAYLTITGLPVTEFYGCGFGRTKTEAVLSAARETVKRLYFAGFITPKLYRFININMGLTKSKKFRKQWYRELISATANVKKLQKALKEGHIPEYLLRSDAELEIAEPIYIKTKDIVQRTGRLLIAAENKRNVELRRKRKAIDAEENELAAQRQNCYVTVISDENMDIDGSNPGVRMNVATPIGSGGGGIDDDDDDDLEPPFMLFNLFGKAAEHSNTTKTIVPEQPFTSVEDDMPKTGECRQIINLFGGGPKESIADTAETTISMPARTPPLSAPRTPVSVKTETTDSGVSVDDDECRIISVLTKEDKIALVTLDDEEGERTPGCSTPKQSSSPPRRNTSPRPIPNRIFDPECPSVADTETPKSEVVGTKKIKRDLPTPSETITLDDDGAVNSGKDIVKAQPMKEAEELEPKYKIMRDKLGVTFASSATNVTSLITSRKQKYAQAFIKFDQEVWQHFRLNSQDDRTFSWKMKIRSKLQDVVREIFPNAHLVAVGSTINGCGAYNSDMDICLCLEDYSFGYSRKKEFTSNRLMELYRQLMIHYRHFVKGCDYIDARVPILKVVLQEPYHELEIDINCNNTIGIYNSHLLHYYSRVDDRFPALCLIVKHWAIRTGINDAYTGTLSSYALELMVLHFLQCGTYPPILPNLQILYPEMFNRHRNLDGLKLFDNFPTPLPRTEINQTTIGVLLIAFFDYYARFDFLNNAISIKRGTVFNRSELPPTTQYFKIFVEDPYEGRNIALTVTRMDNFRKIQNSFTAARNAFLGFCAGEPSLANIGVQS